MIKSEYVSNIAAFSDDSPQLQNNKKSFRNLVTCNTSCKCTTSYTCTSCSPTSYYYYPDTSECYPSMYCTQYYAGSEIYTPDSTNKTCCIRYCSSYSATMSCQSCSKKCKTCFGGLETQCIQCANPSQFFDQNNYCVDSCQANYIKNPNTNKCQQCLYYSANLDKPVCVFECPSQFYADSNNICQKCGNNCKHCLDQQTCIECNKNYSFKNSSKTECTICQTDEYKDENNICQKCQILNCETCTSKTICQTCAIGYFNKQTHCEYDQRYDHYTCSYSTQEQCEQELKIITKADTSMQSVQIVSFGVQTVNTLFFAQGSQFTYSLQIQQMIGNTKFSDKFKTLSIGSTFIDLNYQMNILSIIPSPLSSSNTQNSNQTQTKSLLQSQRILENNASSSDLRRIQSIDLSKLFLSDALIYFMITGIFILIMAICKLLSKKYLFFSEIDEKKIKYCKKRFIVSKNQYYEEDIRQKQIQQFIDKNHMRIKVRSGILNPLEKSLSLSQITENDSRIEYMDNIHQLSIKWNKNPIYTRNVALSTYKKQ
ncbi:hypothetical protein ABPG73_006865 [Tetrahymena malaccensis]